MVMKRKEVRIRKEEKDEVKVSLDGLDWIGVGWVLSKRDRRTSGRIESLKV